MRRSGHAQASGGQDKVPLFERENLRAKDARGVGPPEEGDDQDDHPGARLQYHNQ